MEFGVVSGASILGMLFTLVVSLGIPIGLMVVGIVKYKAKVTSFLIGAGVFILFALTLYLLFPLCMRPSFPEISFPIPIMIF